MTALSLEDFDGYRSDIVDFAEYLYELAIEEEDPETSLKDLLCSAEHGNATAQLFLGLRHISAKTPDVESALNWFRKSAVNSCVNAPMAIATTHFKFNWDFREARVEAVAYWARAMELHSTPAGAFREHMDALPGSEILDGCELLNQMRPAVN